MQLQADTAITLNCQDTFPYVIGVVEDWDGDDPADQLGVTGSSPVPPNA